MTILKKIIIDILYTIFFGHVYKIVNSMSAKYHQKKRRLKKMLVKGIKIFLERKKNYIVANDIKTFLKMKNKG